MNTGMNQLLKIWSLRLSLGIAILIALLSRLKGLRLFDLTIRAAVSFMVLYLLFFTILMIFQKTALPEPETESSTNERGGLIDFSVGDEGASSFTENTKTDGSLFPGQVDPGLSSGLEDSKRKADIVRRMGWD